MHDLG